MTSSMTSVTLPDGWTAHESRTYAGVRFYFHAKTGRRQWTAPSDETIKDASANRAASSRESDAPDNAASQWTSSDSDSIFAASSLPSRPPPVVARKRHRTSSQHYDAQARETFSARRRSNVIGLRKANNMVKARTIEGALIRAKQRTKGGRLTVLDLGCGKGGDLPKFGALTDQLDVEIDYYGIDISKKSIDVARKRYEQTFRRRWPRLHVHVVVGDFCSEQPLPDRFPVEFDLISVQFALHYAFESEVHCRAFFRTVDRVLKNSGELIVTVVDAEVLRARMRGSGSSNRFIFGNHVFSAHMSQDAHAALMQRADTNACGVRYTFWLDGCIDHCDEFVISRAHLKQICASCSLEAVYWTPFPMFQQGKRLSRAEQEVHELYVAAAFQRKVD